MIQTHKKRIKKQTISLWLTNLPIMLLTWGLSGVITIAASNSNCSNVELGPFGFVLSNVMGLHRIYLTLAIFGVFYAMAGFLLYMTGSKLKLRDAQRKIFKPFIAPSLFQTAGYFLGIAAPLMSELKFGIALAIALSILILATVLASIYEILETGDSCQTA